MMTKQKDDWYPTPPEATEAPAARTFDDKVWEPACGDGAISEHLKLHDYDVVMISNITAMGPALIF